MAKIEWVHLRLERWAMWVARGRCGGGGSTAPMWRQTPRSGYTMEAQVPLNEAECWDTEAAIKELDEPFRSTVAWHYMGSSLNMSRAVLSQRIDRAHRLLAIALSTHGPIEESIPRSFPPLTK